MPGWKWSSEGCDGHAVMVEREKLLVCFGFSWTAIEGQCHADLSELTGSINNPNLRLLTEIRGALEKFDVVPIP